MLDFLTETQASLQLPPCSSSAGEGEVAEISYSVRGHGPPLVLFPLSLASSQWEPLIPSLSEHFTTVTIGGRHVGLVRVLEDRARAPGYVRVVRTMLAEADLRPGESVLEVGCGSGALVRDLARRTGGANAITAIEISPYMLREAAALARAEGLEAAIDFRQGDAQALPIEDGVHGLTFSSTVMEEVDDADRMLAELVRVTRPAGRVAVAVRALDLPHVLNLDLPDDIRRKLEAPRVGAGVAEGGCADSSLYERFARSGLTDIRMLPSWTLNAPPGPLWVTGSKLLLTPAEGETFQAALRRGSEGGTAFAGQPMHVAVGTKP